MIERALKDALPSARVDVYRYDPYSLRARIVDRSFEGKSLVEREEPVFRVIRALPDETQQDLTMLILLTPKEQKTSMMNLEFDDPTPSAL
jgi:stress-induced morphogen